MHRSTLGAVTIMEVVSRGVGLAQWSEVVPLASFSVWKCGEGSRSRLREHVKSNARTCRALWRSRLSGRQGDAGAFACSKDQACNLNKTAFLYNMLLHNRKCQSLASSRRVAVFCWAS